jgi:hypothetical protein
MAEGGIRANAAKSICQNETHHKNHHRRQNDNHCSAQHVTLGFRCAIYVESRDYEVVKVASVCVA